MGERMEVMVVCWRCNGSGKDPSYGSGGTNQMPEAAPCMAAYGGCGGSGRVAATLAPSNSLTAARLRLADAAEAKEVTLNAFAAPEADENGPECEAWLAACNEYKAALSDLAALRTKRAGG